MTNRLFKLLSLSLVATMCSCSNAAVPSISDLKCVGPANRVTEAQNTYLVSENVGDTTPYNGNMSVSAPNAVELSWKGSGVSNYFVNFYSDSQMNDLAVSYKTKKKEFKFYNTELNKKYFINVTDNNKRVMSDMVEYQYSCNSLQPRNLFVDGVENIRDLGGWGSYMKQGMIYRSGRFNEDKADPVNVTVTEDGLYELNNHLKIKTEIDLRRSSTNEIGSLTKSPLGDNVNYYNLPMYYGGNNILTFAGKASGDDYEYNNPAMIKSFFEILADENNYPIDFHCSIGKDRTGCMAYLIEGLLGFDQEVMYRDYMFTNFANAGMCKLTDITDRYGKTISEYEGKDLQEKTYKYLNEVIGVSAANLDSIINILK